MLIMYETLPTAHTKCNPFPSSNMCISVINRKIKLNFITSFPGFLKFKELVASMNIFRIFNGEFNLSEFGICVKCAQ
jgi:hypothetical protein